MTSQWYSVVSQKLHLARVLLVQEERGVPVDNQPPAVLSQAMTQATAEMLLRAQQALLVMVARYHQHKQAQPRSLSELESLFAYPVPDVEALQQLAADPNSWWNHLAKLDKALSEPATPRKQAAAENVIAIASEPETDFSPAALEKTRSAMAAFSRELADQHSEW